MEVPLGDTYYFLFTTRQFSDGAPTTLAGTPALSVYEENNLTQITTGVAVTADYDSVTGLNECSVVATTGNGYEVGKYYSVVITTGTVGGTSVVGEVVGHFRIMPAEDAAAGVKDVNVTHWLDTAAATPTTAGVPEVDVTFWAGSATATNDVAIATAPTNFADLSITATTGRVDVDSVGGTAQTANDNGADLNTLVTRVPDTISLANINTEVDNSMVTYGLDHLVSAAVADTDVADNSIVAKFADSTAVTADYTNFDWTTDSLRAIRDHVGDGTNLTEAGGTGDHLTAIGGFGANTITAAALATDAVDEISDGVWDELMAGHVTSDSAGEVMNDWQDGGRLDLILDARMAEASINTTGGAVDTVTAVTNDVGITATAVDNIWDEDIVAAHNTADTAGAILNNILPESNAAFNNIPFLFVDSTDHVTPVTSATGTSATRSIDGGAFGSATGTLAEIGNGIYQFDASAADMNGTIITFRFVATGGTPNAPDDVFVTVKTTG